MGCEATVVSWRSRLWNVVTRRRHPHALQTWQVAQPDYALLCALCQHPVMLYVPTVGLNYLETCSMCGIAIIRTYAGPSEDVCIGCQSQYMPGPEV